MSDLTNRDDLGNFDNDAEPTRAVLKITCSKEMYDAYMREAARRQLSYEGLLEVLWNLGAEHGHFRPVRMRRKRKD